MTHPDKEMIHPNEGMVLTSKEMAHHTKAAPIRAKERYIWRRE